MRSLSAIFSSGDGTAGVRAHACAVQLVPLCMAGRSNSTVLIGWICMAGRVIECESLFVLAVMTAANYQQLPDCIPI